MKNYERVLDDIASKFDLRKDIDLRKAFNACVEFADRELVDSIDYNYFMSQAGSRFGCDPVIKNVLRLVPSDGSEKVILRYSKEGGPCLSGNQSGLQYLSKAFAVLATSPLAGDHFHLRYQEFPVVGRSFPLTVYCDDETWFENQVKADASSEDAVEAVPEKTINPTSVKALIILDHIPEPMLLTTDRVYAVLSVVKLVDQKVWTKNIREDRSRMYVFEMTNDDGQPTYFGLDLDDKGVVFITEDNAKRICPNQAL